MKIQDIFNLPKNRGGARLFQRIMNRYGIPKEDSKELKNNVDNSSSGGGSSRVEYYNVINEDSFNEIFDICMLDICIHSFTDKHHITSPLLIYGNENVHIISIKYSPSYISKELIDVELSDNFYNAFYKCIKMINSEMSDEQIREYFNSIFTPITEEEFYNLN